MIELAHGVGRTFESPIPVWLYAVGAAATVGASFVVRAIAPDNHEDRPQKRVASAGFARGLSVALRVAGVAGLLLTLVAGLITSSEGFTLPPLLLWVGLVVGMVLLSTLIDGVWGSADPWSTLEGVYRLEGAEVADRTPPWWLGPLLLYGLFWFELVSGVGFDASYVVIVLVAYSVFAFATRNLFGKNWSLVDPLSILFGFAGRFAPLRLEEGGIFYRGAVRALDESDPIPLAWYASVFVLLASTTLDNVRETVGWSEFLTDTGLKELPDKIVDSTALVVFALFFFLPFLLVMWLARAALRRPDKVVQLGRFFAWSLIPIGVAYVVAHNIPLLMVGVPQIIRSLSDPFEKGWDLLGTSGVSYLPSPRLVWFLEIAVIVGGHILGVLAAHRAAVRLGESRKGAVRSQIALTALMSVFTITTLWLLAQPLVTT